MNHRLKPLKAVTCLAAVLALAGCGSAAVGAGSGTTGSTTSTTFADEGPPTAIPFERHAPAEFTERAEHIASVLRASGALDAYAHDHPEVRAFRKVGKPTVALRFLDVNPAVKPLAGAGPAAIEGGSTGELSDVG